MQNSGIEWTDHTGNLWWGCEEVRPECDNCYAKATTERWGWRKDLKKKSALWGKDSPRLYMPGVWDAFRKFQQLAEKGQGTKTEFGGGYQSVFVGSMMDVAERHRALINHKGERLYCDFAGNISTSGAMAKGYTFATTEHLRKKYFTEIIPETPNLLHLLLTKRPSNYKKIIPISWFANPPGNVMFGTSVGSANSLMMVDQLLSTGTQFRYFLSCEPMIGGFSLEKYLAKLAWVICGGESGSKKRPVHLDWARVLRDQCAAAGVPFFMKQVDKVQPIPADLMIREFPKQDKIVLLKAFLEEIANDKTYILNDYYKNKAKRLSESL